MAPLHRIHSSGEAPGVPFRAKRGGGKHQHMRHACVSVVITCRRADGRVDESVSGWCQRRALQGKDECSRRRSRSAVTAPTTAWEKQAKGKRKRETDAGRGTPSTPLHDALSQFSPSPPPPPAPLQSLRGDAAPHHVRFRSFFSPYQGVAAKKGRESVGREEGDVTTAAVIAVAARPNASSLSSLTSMTSPLEQGAAHHTHTPPCLTPTDVRHDSFTHEWRLSRE